MQWILPLTEKFFKEKKTESGIVDLSLVALLKDYKMTSKTFTADFHNCPILASSSGIWFVELLFRIKWNNFF